MHEHSKGNTQRKMLSEATRDTHYRNLRSWSKSTPQLKLKQMEDHRRLQDHSDMTSRMTSTPEKPSISWQVIMQGTLETGDEGCKSILVCTPAFTEQTFILLKQQQKRNSWFQTYAFISCPWTHLKTILLWTGIMLSIKNISAKSIRQMSTGTIRSLKCEVTRECQHPWQGQ